ncbi:helix-turn-helix domain-containing protein [Hoeflea sp. AS16]|uniref:helix-turn-helix domain-containing protein n=1 Tax=Hoeflea sp. AS16 TaxID=3135779 RepID=UPI00318042AA
MTFRRKKFTGCNSTATPKVVPAARTPGVNALSGPVLGGETVVALAALAGGAGLSELLGLAGAPGPVSTAGAAPPRPGDPAGRITFVDILRCRVTWRLVAELFAAACERDLPAAAARRRPRCHMRQIAMYLSHVVLSVPYQTIATAFGRDRTTVMHACSVVEDRRDDAGYDRFVEQCERCISAVFAPLGNDDVEL